MPCMDIALHHRIELEHAKPVLLSLNEAVLHQHFPDMQAATCCADRIAGVADVSAPPHIVGMQDVQPVNLSSFGIFRNAAIALAFKKFPAGLFIQTFLLRKGDPLLHHLIPDPDHGGQICVFIFSDHDIHNGFLFSLSKYWVTDYSTLAGGGFQDFSFYGWYDMITGARSEE